MNAPASRQHQPGSENQPLISVLVPVYNAIDRLPACMGSILAQTWQNLEVILVDDGSTDGSGQWCDACAGQDARVRVIHQENGGNWAARNTALEHAAGEYLAWVDSDDMVFPGFLQHLFDLLRRFGTGMALCRFEDTTQTTLPAAPRPPAEPDCLMDFAQYADALQGIRETEMIALWNKLYKKELWDGMRFVEKSFIDDGYVVWKVAYRAGRIAVSTLSLYLYYQNPNSVTHNAQATIRGVRNADCLAERYLFFKRHGYRWPAGMTLRRCYENIARFYQGLGGSPEEKAAKNELRRVFFRLLPHALASRFFGRRAKLYLLGAALAPRRVLPALRRQIERA